MSLRKPSSEEVTNALNSVEDIRQKNVRLGKTHNTLKLLGAAQLEEHGQLFQSKLSSRSFSKSRMWLTWEARTSHSTLFGFHNGSRVHIHLLRE